MSTHPKYSLSGVTGEYALTEEVLTRFSVPLHLGPLDMDSRGLHWRLAKEVPPQQRLEFALAVYFAHGLYVLVAAERGFLCVERIALHLAQLIKARQSGSYLIGHAFAKLLDSLGYADHETLGFDLIEAGDLANPKAFIKGFSDSVAQSMESDVMRIVRGNHDPAERSGSEQLVENLCHYIAECSTNATIERSFVI